MKTNSKKLLTITLWLVCAILIAINGFGLAVKYNANASYYCDDGLYEGEGAHVSSTYIVEYDSYVEHNEYRVNSAPGLHGGTNTTNDCAATAGTNVVAFYDRYYTNMIPNYEPGVTVGGSYRYFPNLGSDKISSLHNTLYNYMNINVNNPGATEDDFKNGLKRYVNEQGYSIGYSSIHQDAQNVNITKLQQMINSKRVAAIFLLGYNFVFSFDVSETSRTVYQERSNAGHIMMVYGYFTVDYYKSGRLFLSETYLQVSSCNSMGDLGYMKLNDFGTIEDAVMISIS